MPHSSGGGSRSGGSHSSSSHRSSGSGGSGTRISNKPFSGSHKFVYYSKGNVNYIYSSSKTPPKHLSKAICIFLTLFYIPFIIAGLSVMLMSYSSPQKVKVYSNNLSVITDTIGVIDNKEELYKSLEKFRLKTGIPVTILTISNDDWKDYYNSLENYAYEKYLNLFNDEQHWLIVYSEDSDYEHNQWYFEGMQGDNTDNVLSVEYTDKFNKRLTDNLYSMYDEGVSKCFADAFECILPSIMKSRFHPELFIFGFIFLTFALFHASLMFGLTPNRLRMRKAVLVPEDSSLIQCNYCSGSYYLGTTNTCPHCGAPIVNPMEEFEQKFEQTINN